MLARLLACATALAALPPVAFAQPSYGEVRGSRYEPQYHQQGYARARRDPGQCYAWCPQDHNPCDPANFKIADGRCKPAGVMGLDH
jgi:hypothetical protein